MKNYDNCWYKERNSVTFSRLYVTFKTQMILFRFTPHYNHVNKYLHRTVPWNSHDDFKKDNRISFTNTTRTPNIKNADNKNVFIMLIEGSFSVLEESSIWCPQWDLPNKWIYQCDRILRLLILIQIMKCSPFGHMGNNGHTLKCWLLKILIFFSKNVYNSPTNDN